MKGSDESSPRQGLEVNMTRQQWDQEGVHCTLQQDPTQALLVVETQVGWELVQACSEGAGFWLFFKRKTGVAGQPGSDATQYKVKPKAKTP